MFFSLLRDRRLRVDHRCTEGLKGEENRWKYEIYSSLGPQHDFSQNVLATQGVERGGASFGGGSAAEEW